MSEQELQLVDYLDKAEDRFLNAPLGMKFDKEKSYAVQLLRANSFLEQTAKKNPISLLSAMSNVASIGLSLNPAKKQAYLVPRSGVVCLDPSYMGLCDLATQSGAIDFVQAKLVYANDQYTNNGVDAQPTHTYDPFKDRGEMVGGYCVAKTAKGDYLTTEMSVEKINDIRDRSEAYKKGFGPWKTDYEEMAKKTVVRNAFKMWPKTETLERLEMAVELSNQNEGFEPIINNPELRDYSPQQKEHFDYLLSTGNAIDLHCFMCSLDEGVQIALHNSFEKGSITKYKKLVSELQQKGASTLIDIEVTVSEAMSSGDDMAAKEVLEGLSQEAVNFLLDRNDQEFGQYVRQCFAELAA